MKGIILAGGTGSRLFPITMAISKQLMPIYDKPMIYYPITTLMKAGIRDMLIITTESDQPRFENLLGDGSHLGCQFSYAIQEKPRGLADAYIVAEDFIDGEDNMMILGDNLFYGTEIDETLEMIKNTGIDGGLVFGYWVANPKRYGVLELDTDFNVLSVEEKPENPKSNYAIPGIYIFDGKAPHIAKTVKPSARGEIEITEVMQGYLDESKLKGTLIGRGSAWLDTGTFESMNQAAQFVQVIEQRQGLKIGCIEEEAFLQGFIGIKQLEHLATKLLKSGYGRYLMDIVESHD